MALVSCPECRREVSDQAGACPGCGYPLRAVASSSLGDSAGTVVKTTGAVLGAWLTAPWIARLVVGVVAMICLFTFLIVGILARG